MPAQSPYTPLPSRVELPSVDHEILAFWRERNVFGRSVYQTIGGPEWVFYDGPPTANGKPGTYHVEARVFKDIFPRFKTMKGFHVPRRAGWDFKDMASGAQNEADSATWQTALSGRRRKSGGG